jgi:hypothetical protein
VEKAYGTQYSVPVYMYSEEGSTEPWVRSVVDVRVPVVLKYKGIIKMSIFSQSELLNRTATTLAFRTKLQ